MKRILLCAAAAASMLGAAETPNLFPNPGFEKWNSKDNLPTQPKWRWKLPTAKSPFTVMEQSSAEKHSGEYSLHLKDDNKDSVNHVLGYSFTPAELKKYSGSIIKFSAWVKQASASAANVVGIGVWAVNAENGKSFQGQMCIPSTLKTDWTQLSLKMRLPEKTKLLIVYLRCANGWGNKGEAWFDDVSLSFDEVKTPAKAAVPAAQSAKAAKAAAKAETEKKKQAEFLASYQKQETFSNDNRPRPEIAKGTFRLGGEYHFMLGPWIYNHPHTDWPDNNPNRHKIPHFAYNERPSKSVYDRMGFNSSQLSAAWTAPGMAFYGLKIDELALGESRIKSFFKNLEDSPLVMDFAFGFAGAFKRQRPAEFRELNQHNPHWHEFIPLCPEKKMGWKYYHDYMRGGTMSALRYGANVSIYELFNESSYQCMCPENSQEFARRMAKKFKTIKAANKVWDTLFSDFDEVGRQTSFHQFPKLWPDYAKFLGDRYVEILKKCRDVVREVDKRDKVYFTEQCSAFSIPQQIHAGMDYLKIADTLDVLATEGGISFGKSAVSSGTSKMEEIVFSSTVRHLFIQDFYQAISKGKNPLINNEHYCTRIENGLRVPSKREDMISSLWSELMHGMSGSYTYSWDKRGWEWKTLADAHKLVEKPSYRSSSLLNPYNWPPSELVGYKMFMQELEPLKNIIMPFPRTAKASVAILFSYPTQRMLRYHRFRYDSRLYKWYGTLLNEHYPIQVVFDHEVAAGLPENIQALIIPSALYSTPEAKAGAEKFAARGGIICADEDAFRYDERGNDLPPFKGKIVRFKADRESHAAGLVKELAKYNIHRYGRVIADGAKLTTSDLQVIDRGDVKLLYFHNDGDLFSRTGRVEWYIADKGEFYLTDPINRLHIVNGKKNTWNKAELKKGFPVVIPGQQRAVYLLRRTAPAKEFRRVDAAGIGKLFAEAQQKEAAHRKRYETVERQQKEKYITDRIYTDVKKDACTPIDLRKFVNMGFRDDVAGDKKGGWFDQGSNDFAGMPEGKITAAGVPFEIISPKANNGKGVIVLYSPNRDFFPKEVKGIPVGLKAANFYFLHAMGWGDHANTPIVTYRLNYEDGSKADLVCRSGKEIGPWWGDGSLTNAKIAIESQNLLAKINMQCCRMANPNPAKKVISMDIISAEKGGVPAIAAITAEK